MGTVEKYQTPNGREGYEARDSWVDATGVRQHAKRKFRAHEFGTLKRAKAEAEAWLRKRQVERSEGVIWEPSREPLGSLIDRWLAGLAHPLSSNTIVRYQSAAKHRFDAQTRAIPIRDLTTAAVRTIVRSWEAQKLAPQSINVGLLILRGAVQLALDERGIRENPIAEKARGERGRKRLPTWSPDQVEQFIAHTADDPHGAVFELLFMTAARVGEITALRWDDIDLGAGIVTIARTWSRDAAGRSSIIDHPKTEASWRVVPIRPHMVARIAQARAGRTFDDDGWITAEPLAAPLNPRAFRRRWDRAVRSSGIIPVLTPHGARHSGATNLIDAGIPSSTVTRLLGHTDEGFTLRTYVHPTDDALADAVATLGALYRGETTISRAQSAPKVVPLRKKAG